MPKCFSPPLSTFACQPSQQYSLAPAIQEYSEYHGFEVVLTYSDAAKRGIVLKNRPTAPPTLARLPCSSGDGRKL